MAEDSANLIVKFDEEKLHVNMEYNYKSGGVLYAFYLLRNGLRVETKWYTPSSEVVFDLFNTGSYKIIAFVKEHEEIVVIKESEEYFYVKSQNNSEMDIVQIDFSLSIYGSCVSRDLLELDGKKLFNFQLGAYIARQAIVSSIAKKNDVNDSDIKLDSAFQRRMVLSDFRKNAFDLLQQNKSEFLVIDLIDERFRITKHNDSVLTYSPYLTECKYKKKYEFIDYQEAAGKYYFNGFNLDIYLREFCRRILEIYDGHKIIIHKAKMLDFYKSNNGEYRNFDKNTINNNRVVNRRMNYVYDFLEREFGNPIVIDICDDYYADEKHKWGLAPMHYCEEYYKKVLQIMYERIVEIKQQ